MKSGWRYIAAIVVAILAGQISISATALLIGNNLETTAEWIAKHIGSPGPGMNQYNIWAMILAIVLYALPSLLLTALMAIALVPRSRLAPHLRCPNCDYFLKGNTSGICPECGARVATKPRDPSLEPNNEPSHKEPTQ